MQYREILPSRIQMLPEFMDGGEPDKNQRLGWPIRSYRSRPPLTADQKSIINTGHCPKCGGLLKNEEVICRGERGEECICTQCGKRWYPDNPPEPDCRNLFLPSPHRPPAGKKTYREFNCKHCGKPNAGMFARNACYCPGTNCYRDATRIANREAYRKSNTTTRDLGK
jgi:transcription elongation factor Elf1